jgi:hypothetical protein
MDNTRFVEEIVKEIKLSEVDSSKVPVTCSSPSIKGVENFCKCGAFLIPLCVVI